jgi:hypothetical protein
MSVDLRDTMYPPVDHYPFAYLFARIAAKLITWAVSIVAIVAFLALVLN